MSDVMFQRLFKENPNPTFHQARPLYAWRRFWGYLFHDSWRNF